MAVITTMIMPPALRWMLARVPLRDEEGRRLEREDEEAKQSVPKMERVLVVSDGSANGLLAARTAGVFCAGERLLTTVLDLPAGRGPRDAEDTLALATLKSAATAVAQHTGTATTDVAEAEQRPAVEELVRGRVVENADAIEKEAAKGYSIAFAGINEPVSASGHRFDGQLDRLVQVFDGPIAIALNANRGADVTGLPLQHPGADGG
jgi:hypothetical protein